MREIKISIETATRWYNGADNELKDLALQTYPELGKKQLPKSWEELDIVKGFFVQNDSVIWTADPVKAVPSNQNVFATENLAESHGKAAAKLSQVMAVYNDGWVVDWNDAMQDKWCILFVQKNLKIHSGFVTKHFLTFKTEQLAEEFLSNFREDIETYFNF
jgi:hypothetical protein